MRNRCPVEAALAGNLHGHYSALSMHYYLQLVEPLCSAAGERFENHYGELVSPYRNPNGGADET